MKNTMTILMDDRSLDKKNNDDDKENII